MIGQLELGLERQPAARSWSCIPLVTKTINYLEEVILFSHVAYSRRGLTDLAFLLELDTSLQGATKMGRLRSSRMTEIHVM